MKRIWVALGAIVALIAIIYTVGALLPQDHRATVRISISAPADSVWAKVGSLESWPRWNASVSGVERSDDVNGNPVWVVHDRTGAMANEVAESAAPDSTRPGKLVLRIADDSLPFGGSWTWDIAASGPDQTTVTLTEDGEVYNPIFRFMSRFVFGHTATAETYLTALGASFGEAVDPEIVEV